MKRNSTQQGSLAAVLVAVLAIALIGALGFIFWQNFIASSTNKEISSMITDEEKNEKPIESKMVSYTIENEELIFDFDSSRSTVKQLPIENTPGELYVVSTEVTTGDVVLTITTGISGIGGTAICQDSRELCKVIDTKAGSYLGKPITYRLVEAKLVPPCGGTGGQSCATIPLKTTYVIDTSDRPGVFAPCCGTISSEARNLGGKAEVAGSVLITLSPSKEIANASLLKNPDLLETIKIVESLRYRRN